MLKTSGIAIYIYIYKFTCMCFGEVNITHLSLELMIIPSAQAFFSVQSGTYSNPVPLRWKKIGYQVECQIKWLWPTCRRAACGTFYLHVVVFCLLCSVVSLRNICKRLFFGESIYLKTRNILNLIPVINPWSLKSKHAHAILFYFK